ncbi:5'-methylthioadenosine/S-adenosylhomocysteine nucleosidase [Streptomyces sp. NBC_01288]|nr:5'-methylthioadenosine/S-adenosylhomocysteine nucleosidase [Streptomyces sp. NBC_01288]
MVILTALPAEYEAVRSHLISREALVHPASGTTLERGVLPGTPWLVALAEIGEGAYTAAVTIERISAWLEPEALLFVGVAGSLREDVRIGDVVVATKVYAYHGGKQTPEGFYARPRAWVVSHRLEQAARVALRGWPGVHFKSIAAGDVVLNGSSAALVDQLRRRYSDAAAIEMEGTGVAHAAHLTEEAETLTIRAISDTADGVKHPVDTTDILRSAAARAAEAAMAVLREVNPRGRPSEAPQSPSDYGGDHLDFRGSQFYGPFTGKRTGSRQDE